MSSAAQPARQTKVEYSITQLRTALREAAQANGMPAPKGGLLGGYWQWLWYASGNADRAYRVDVSAEPSADGVTVSGHSLSWNRRGERDAKGKTWYSHLYPYDESRSDLFLDHLCEKLKCAWDSAVEAAKPTA